ncbi:hypothetical protein E2320_000732 [Naja naja]|nr:hypothetical protein E2320_000732 [Naja naja]
MATAPGPTWMPRWTGAHRSLEKALQGLTKLQQLACQPQVALRNSPPHLPSLLPLIYQHLRLIREHYGAGLAEVWESDFFRIFLLNLLEKIKQATRLFKRGKDKEEILLEGSAASRVSQRGGPRQHVPAEQARGPGLLEGHLEGTPWPTLLKNWTYLAVTHPGYMAFLTYDEVKARLQAYVNKPGSYIFRLSCTRLGQWAIGYVTADRGILQTIPQKKSLFQALVDGHKEGFQVESTFQLCKICAENNKDVQIRPCGHLLCRECLKSWQTHSSSSHWIRDRPLPSLPQEHPPSISSWNSSGASPVEEWRQESQ